MREALLEPISTIVDSVALTLERWSAELSGGLGLNRAGLCAAGGRRATARFFDKLLSEETGFACPCSGDPPPAQVAEGNRQMPLMNLNFLRPVASADPPLALIIADTGKRKPESPLAICR